MARKGERMKDPLRLTPQEAESMGVELEGGLGAASGEACELPLHEQVAGALNEDDVAEALTGEVTPESREAVEDFFADVQEATDQDEGAPQEAD